MSSRSKSSETSNHSNKTLNHFDRGAHQFLLSYFSALTKQEIISIQLLFLALLEVLSLNLTYKDPTKARPMSQLMLFILQQSGMIPKSMGSSAKHIRQLPIFQDYVLGLKQCIRTALDMLQPDSASSSSSTITNLLANDFDNIVLASSPSANITTDIPQQDFQLKIPIPLIVEGSITKFGFDNAVVFRYVQEFKEIDKIGKGAFGSVFRAKNRLDDCTYAVKKIVFNENTSRTRRQAQRALREVRVLASLSHPNIVHYHCAWLELVPVGVRKRSVALPPKIKDVTSPVRKEFDSLDSIIQFEGQSASSPEKQQHSDEEKSSSKSSTSSTDGDNDENGTSACFTNGKHGDAEAQQQYHSDGDCRSSSTSKRILKDVKSHYETTSDKKSSTKELIPFHGQNQFMPSLVQSIYSNSKIVLFIQMQLCDTTLHEWLRGRDHSISNESSEENKKVFCSLTNSRQHQCWHIFKQLLTAVQYLHSQSFVHRDIKPRNIFLSYDSPDRSSFHVKLGDFGLATIFDSESASDFFEQIRNDESTGVGTVLYAPPEQFNSNHCLATAKSDSFSLGIVLFEMFNVFPTEMERYSSLNNLRSHLTVDDQFKCHYPFETNLIEQLVSAEPDKRLSADDVMALYLKETQLRNRRSSSTKQMIIKQLKEKLQAQDILIQRLELELEKKNNSP